MRGGSTYLRTNVMATVLTFFDIISPPAHQCANVKRDLEYVKTSLETVKRSLRASPPLWVSFGVSAASQKRPRAAGGSATGQERPSTRTRTPQKNERGLRAGGPAAPHVKIHLLYVKRSIQTRPIPNTACRMTHMPHTHG